MRTLRQRAKNSERPRDTQSIAHRGKALHLRGMRQVFRVRDPPQDSQCHAHRREKVLLRPVWQSFHAEIHVGRSQTLPHW